MVNVGKYTSPMHGMGGGWLSSSSGRRTGEIRCPGPAGARKWMDQKVM